MARRLLQILMLAACLTPAWGRRGGGTPPAVSAAPPAKAAPGPTRAPVRAGPLWGYFHPAWVPGGADRFAESALNRLARDPQGLIEAEFQIPEELRPRVVFWAAIYSRYDSRTKVIHDRNDPSIVYGYLDFTSLYEKQGRMAATVQAARIERAVLARLQTALLAVASLAPSPLSEEHDGQLRRFLAARGLEGRNVVAELARTLRSQTGQADAFQDALERSERSLPRMERVFASHGLPKGLARIPFVESSFNPRARSKVGAMGLWQFMPRTAREMIHRSNRKLWRDPERQTVAAAKLLKRYRRALPDWASTITSYNSGIGRVGELLRKHPNGLAAILMAQDDELGFAGKNFYAEVLAANLVEAYKHRLFPGRMGNQIGAAEFPAHAVGG